MLLPEESKYLNEFIEHITSEQHNPKKIAFLGGVVATLVLKLENENESLRACAFPMLASELEQGPRLCSGTPSAGDPTSPLAGGEV